MAASSSTISGDFVTRYSEVIKGSETLQSHYTAQIVGKQKNDTAFSGSVTAGVFGIWSSN